MRSYGQISDSTNAEVIRAEVVEMTAFRTAMSFALWTEAANWFYAQLLSMPDDKREEFMSKKESTKKMLALFGV